MTAQKNKWYAAAAAYLIYIAVFCIFAGTVRIFFLAIPLIGFTGIFYAILIWGLLLWGLRAGYVCSTAIAIIAGLALGFPLPLGGSLKGILANGGVSSIDVIEAVLPTVIAQQLLCIAGFIFGKLDSENVDGK